MATGADFPYRLTAHAARVIAERDIVLEWVERALRTPARTETDRLDPALRHALAPIQERGDRILRVIYNPLREPWEIVTAYFDRTQRGKV